MKVDFDKEQFDAYVSQFIGSSSIPKVMLAYRLARYAQHNKEQNTKRPMLAVITLTEKKQKVSACNIIALLLHFVQKNSYLLTDSDIKMMFGSKELAIVNCLLDIENIINSRAVLTKQKLRTYKFRFPRTILEIKAAEVLANLKSLDTQSEVSYLKKVYKRCLPLFDLASPIGDVVAYHLRKTVLRKGVSDAISTNSFDFYQIVNDRRFV